MLQWGQSKAIISGEFRPQRDAAGAPTAWNFVVKADAAVLAVEEFGLAPMQVDEWQATGSYVPQEGRVTLSRLAIRSGDASIALSGDFVDAPDADAVHLAGEVSPMPVDTLKRFWPKFLAGKARDWVLQRVAGGQVHWWKFSRESGPGRSRQAQGAGEDIPPDAVKVELNLSGMSIVYIDENAAGPHGAG